MKRADLIARYKKSYDGWLSKRRKGLISSGTYEARKLEIFQKQIAHNADIRDRREERQMNIEGANLMAKLVRRDERRSSSVVPNDLMINQHIVSEEEQEETVREMWRRVQGQETVRILNNNPINIDGTIHQLDTGNINIGSGDKGYKEFRAEFKTDGTDSEYLFSIGDKLTILKPTTIPAVRLHQKFRDGINHCVFTPLLQRLNDNIEDASASTRKRIVQRIKKLTMLQVMYADGVPETKMEEVARASGIQIYLLDILGETLNVYNKDGRGAILRLTNTRENHVDIGMVVDTDATEVNQEQLIEIWNSVKDKKTFYMIDGDLTNGLPSRIRTLHGAWSLENKVRDACKEFDKELGIINYKINALKQPELNAFLKAGRIVNGWSCDLTNPVFGTCAKPTGCADMPSAYSQFGRCHKYAGFLGHIHQYRSGSFTKEFVMEHLGYYGFKILGGITDLMYKLGLRVGQDCVLFSPELLYFMDDGLQVDINQGAWGSKFDFEFPEYMMKDRAYCIWAGRLGIERDETSHTISATKDWASHLAVDHKVFYWKEKELLTIKKPVKQCFTAHHILGAMTSYVRIQMMEAMKCFKPENLVRVVLDGIYYKGDKPAELAWFNDKPVKSAESSMAWYDQVNYTPAPVVGKILKNSLLTGQGGSGKTYSIFMDKGFNTVLYVAPSHILGQDVKDKYGAKYTTIHKLIGIDCQPYLTEFRVPPVIFVDEITQIDAEWVNKVFELYPESLILLAGDIDNTGRWFQCRSGSGKEWNTIWKPSNVDVIEYLEDFRSRDEELKALKLKVRDAMRKCDLGSGLYQMEEWASRKLPISEFKFVEGDTCIAGTHRTNNKLLEMGIVSGYYKKGGYVSTKELPGYEKRGSFTIHSYQGKTIDSGNIWIAIDDLFEYAMLYTAISRAVSIDQIKFIKTRKLILGL